MAYDIEKCSRIGFWLHRLFGTGMLKTLLIKFSVCRGLAFGVVLTNILSAESPFVETVKSKEPEPARTQRCDFWGSYIYWQPRQEFMDVALLAIPGDYNVVSGISWSRGHLIEMPMHMASGVRAGTSVSNSFCDVEAECIVLHTENRISKAAPSDGALFARWIEPNVVSDNKATFVDTTWKLEFNNLNLEMGKSFQAASRFVLQPKLGVAFAWIMQRLKSETLLNDPGVPALPTVSLLIKNQSHSLGIGPRLGLDGKLTLWSSGQASFDLIGHIAGALLVTRYHLELNQKSPNQTTIFIHSRDVITVMQPEVEMYFGLGYTDHTWSLEVGYDEQIWFYQNMIRWYNDTTYVSVPRGNLSFSGPRATFSLKF